MSIYNLIDVITRPILTYATYKLLHAFLPELCVSRKREVITYVIYFLGATGLGLLTRVPIVACIGQMIGIYMLACNYEGKVGRRVTVTLVSYGFLVSVELIVSVCFGYQVMVWEASQMKSIVGLILMRVISMIAAYLIEKYIGVRRQKVKIPNVYYLGIILILFGTLYLFISSLLKAELSLMNVIINGFIFIFINFILLFIDERIFKALTLENERQILKEQMNAYAVEVEIIQQSNDDIRILKHDMKNHVIALQQLYVRGNQEEIHNYVDSVVEKLDTQHLVNTGNPCIDGIINYKLEPLIKKGVDVQVTAVIPEKIHLNPYDLTVILGNLLDNASKALENVADKKLVIDISYSLGSLILIMDNTYDGIIQRGENGIQTRKSNKHTHGIGLRSVEESVHQCDGELIISYDERVFSVEVVIPIK